LYKCKSRKIIERNLKLTYSTKLIVRTKKGVY